MTASISYGDTSIRFRVVRTANVTGKIRIHVYPNGKVEVEAPKDTSEKDVVSALRKRARWVSLQLTAQAKASEHVLPRTYSSGETHFYLGRRYVLKVLKQSSNEKTVRLWGGQLQVATNPSTSDEVKRALDLWYRQRANLYFARRIEELSSDLAWIKQPPSLKLRTMKTQWGNCSPSGTVCLNPRLIKAPRDCIDYVLMHELAHIPEHNHSKRFYALMDRNLPNWRQIKSRLDGMAEMLLAE
jgi:predicted metal-dependent hydrolase